MSEVIDKGVPDEATARAILSSIEAAWPTIEGPASAGFFTRQKQGSDTYHVYKTWTFGEIGKEQGTLHRSAKSASMLTEWFLDALTEYATDLNLKPETHQIVWRHKPEVTIRNGRWWLYARFDFMATDSWMLETEQ